MRPRISEKNTPGVHSVASLVVSATPPLVGVPCPAKYSWAKVAPGQQLVDHGQQIVTGDRLVLIPGHREPAFEVGVSILVLFEERAQLFRVVGAPPKGG
jgi:hypothetical protein